MKGTPLVATGVTGSLEWRCFTTPWWRIERDRWESWCDAARLPIFLRSFWLDAVVYAFRPKLRLWVAFMAGEPVGAMPLEACLWYGIPAWRWLGAASLCPDHLDMVAPPTLQDVLWRSLLGVVIKEAPPLFLLAGLREECVLPRMNPPNELTLWRRLERRCPYLSLSSKAGWSAIETSLKPKLRQELRYLSRRIARDCPIGAVHEIKAPDAIASALNRIASWSQAQHGYQSVWKNEAFKRFHLYLAPQLAALGQLGLFGFGPVDAPWALAYGFRDQNVFRYYQPAFDRSMARYSPGKLLVAELLQIGLREGWDEFDFLLGDEPYKFEWNPQCRAETELRFAVGRFGRLLTGLMRKYDECARA